MKILFLLYSELDCNSGYHADVFASRLSKLGHETLVVHAGGDAGSEPLNYRVLTHVDFFRNTADHLRDFVPEIVFAWTPREIVRLLWEKLVRESSQGFKLVIHFEDNETHLAENCQLEMIASASNLKFFDPERGPAFVEQADGLTFVTESLQEITPPEGRPHLTLNAPYDDRIFAPAPRNDSWRRERGIADHTSVIVYSGNVHRLNFPDVRMLYDAVDRISRDRSVLLIRTGTGMPIDRAGDRVLDLGVVPRRDLPEILAAADLFVQPGRPGPFDNYRFPSKIPEMAIIGRPLICPRLPCLSAFSDREEVFKCEMEDPDAIGDAVTEVMTTPGLHERLSRGSTRAALRECDPAMTAPALAEFFSRMMGSAR